MFIQMGQLEVQPIMAAGAQPLPAIGAVALLWAEVELDGKFQMVHTVAVAQQHVELAQGVASAADRQVGRQQLDPGACCTANCHSRS